MPEASCRVGYQILRIAWGCPNGCTQRADNYCYASPVLLIKRLEEQMEHAETGDTDKKPPARAIIFADPQTAIDSLLDDCPIRVKGLCSVGPSSVIAQRVLGEVEAALERTARAKNGF
jgi:hypothetical protein